MFCVAASDWEELELLAQVSAFTPVFPEVWGMAVCE